MILSFLFLNTIQINLINLVKTSYMNIDFFPEIHKNLPTSYKHIDIDSQYPRF